MSKFLTVKDQDDLAEIVKELEQHTYVPKADEIARFVKSHHKEFSTKNLATIAGFLPKSLKYHPDLKADLAKLACSRHDLGPIETMYAFWSLQYTHLKYYTGSLDGMIVDIPNLIEVIPDGYVPELHFHMIKNYHSANAAGQIINTDDLF